MLCFLLFWANLSAYISIFKQARELHYHIFSLHMYTLLCGTTEQCCDKLWDENGAGQFWDNTIYLVSITSWAQRVNKVHRC